MRKFSKAHVAAVATAVTGLVAAFVPSMPPEAVAGIGAFITWAATYAVPNKG